MAALAKAAAISHARLSIGFCAMLEFARLVSEHSRFGVRRVTVVLALFAFLPVASLTLLLLALPVLRRA